MEEKVLSFGKFSAVAMGDQGGFAPILVYKKYLFGSII